MTIDKSLESPQKDQAKDGNLILVTLILVLLTIFQTWPDSEAPTTEHSSAHSLPASYSLETAMHNWVSKITIGSTAIVENQKRDLKSDYPEELNWYKNFDFIKPYLQSEEVVSKEATLIKLILAGHLNLQNDFKSLLEDAIEKYGRTNQEFIDLARFAYGEPENYKYEYQKYNLDYLKNVRIFMNQELGWAGDLLFSDSIKSIDNELYTSTYSELITQAKRSAILFGITVSIISAGLIGGFLTLIYLLTVLATGKFTFNFTPNFTSKIFPPRFLILVFNAYLIGMNLTFLIVRLSTSIPEDKLLITLILTLSLAILVLWPVYKGVPLKQMLSSIGISKDTFNIKEFFIGPLFIAASWPLFGVLLSFYQLLLKNYGVDIGEGEHPVIPVFLGAESSTLVLYLFIFAVIVAPIVEEIMFRGVFFSWLRNRFNFFGAALVSALVFAVIHPQGAIGLLPLSLIGFGLAFIREWRGSLLACITAHATVNGMVMLFVLQLR